MKFLLSMLVGIGFAIMYLLNDIRMELAKIYGATLVANKRESEGE